MKDKQQKDNKYKYKFSRMRALLITLLGVLMIFVIIGTSFGLYAVGVNFAMTEITLDKDIVRQCHAHAIRRERTCAQQF